ncbi:ABC transporter permease, partial [Bacteroidota bacterium]
MIKNYIKVALRNLIRNLGFSIINILGLAIGIACTVLIFLFVNFELSFDKFHEKSDRIYRIGLEALIGNTEIRQLGTSAPIAAALYDEYPEIEAVCRFLEYGSFTTKYEEKEFIEERVLLIDSTFFKIFSFPLLKGKAETALSSPFQCVLTESLAEKYFGSEDPLNKIITFNDTIDFTVSGIIEDIPDNSHLHFDILLSLYSFDGTYNNPYWDSNMFQTYMLLKENTSYKKLEEKFPEFIDKYIFSERDYSEWASSGNKWEWFLQPLIKIHLTPDLAMGLETNGNITYVYIFSIVAIFILLIACINFMNLSTAKASKRSLEVGIRKIVGSGRRQLRIQFIGESILLSLFALAIGMAIVESILPFYKNFIGQQGLKIHYFDNIYVIPSLLGLALVVGIISGSYPALFLSSLPPLVIIKSRSGAGSKSSKLRNFLVIFQFTISIVLITGALTIYKQVNLLKNEDLGFNKKDVIIVRNIDFIDNINPFKQTLLQHPNILNVSASMQIPGSGVYNVGFTADSLEKGFTLYLHMCDNDFDKVMELEILKGRFFSEDYPTDKAGIVINESALKLLGYENPIGKKLYNDFDDPPGVFPIIGVMKDYHYQSKHQNIRPMALFHYEGFWKWGIFYVTIRYNPDKLTEVLDYVRETWDNFSPQFPHNITFLADDYDSIYQDEEQTNKLFLIFSVLSIFIACLGLLGLSSFMAEQRKKEIGVRKVLGATVGQMIIKLSKDITKWIICANLLAI